MMKDKWSIEAVLISLICISCLISSWTVEGGRNNDDGKGSPEGWTMEKLRRKRHSWSRKGVSEGDNPEASHHQVHLEEGENVNLGTVWESNDGFLLDSQGKLLNPDVFKSLLTDLVLKLDNESPNTTLFTTTTSLNMFPRNRGAGHRRHRGGGAAPASRSLNGHSKRHINSLRHPHHCRLHGLWLSTVAGAAIELKPERREGHVEIHTRIFELPDNPYPPLLTSQWTGKGIISQESPTTLTILFQEHIDAEKENHAGERDNGIEPEPGDRDSSPIVIQLPRTAVFIGQCLVCHGNPMLQGSWVVFPSSQTCGAGAGFSVGGIDNGFNGNEQQGLSPSGGTSSQDTIYLLRYL